MKKIFCLVILTLCGRLLAQNQQQLIFGATTNLPGATLVFETASNYITDSGFCFPTVSGSVQDPNLNFDPSVFPYSGYYYNCVQVFNALPATADNGGPVNGAAALGTVIQMRLLSVAGPAGASFAFWEGNSDGTFGTNLTWSVPVPSSGDTNLIAITQAANTSTNDPYGLIQNRVFGFTKPGRYKLTWELVDTSTNGPGGKPMDTNSAPFALYYQADCTISGITSQSGVTQLTFDAPYYGSYQPDNSQSSQLIYEIQQTAQLGTNTIWSTVLNPQNGYLKIKGDDYLHTNTVPTVGATRFYRLYYYDPNAGG
jgi:hypothetical protein